MDPHPSPSKLPRLPRYPIEESLNKRTKANDERALQLAQFAATVLEKQRQKATRHKIISPENEGDRVTVARSGHEEGDNGNGGDHSAPGLRTHSAYGDVTTWPKRGDALAAKGGLQYSWSNIGFPNDISLCVEDLEAQSNIDKDDLNVMELAADVLAMKNKSAKDIADDGVVEVERSRQRIKELFLLRGHRVAKVVFEDVDANSKGVNYGKVGAGKAFSKAVDNLFPATKPSLETEQLVLAHVLLSRGGQIGGRTDAYWKTARGLAQQHIFLDPGLDDRLRQEHLRQGGIDQAFEKMLRIVKKCLAQNAINPYHQAQRDDFAVRQGLFDHIKDVEMAMILDKNCNVITFVCSDAVRKLFSTRMERAIAEALDTFSTEQPCPTPDMTRHGLHYCQWLVDRPDLDFRKHENNPRKAKSGVYHYGCRFAIGDPNGEGKKLKKAGPCPTKDSERIEGPLLPEHRRLRFGALGALTEIVSFFFKLLEPALFAQYTSVVDEVRNFDPESRFPTRKELGKEPFAMRALLVNLMINEHKDTGDWKNGMVGLTMLGDFKGGDLLLRELGLQISSGPGSMQLMRGRDLRHSISKYTGCRFVVVHTNHEAVRRWALRRLGQQISDTGTTTVNSCLDKNAEDYLPEDQVTESSRDLFPERYEEESNEEQSGAESEASLPEKYPRPSKTNLVALSVSSEASAEKSADDGAEAARKCVG